MLIMNSLASFVDFAKDNRKYRNEDSGTRGNGGDCEIRFK